MNAPVKAPRPAAAAHRAPFYWLATFALVVALLSRGKDVLMPLALAVVIAFALTPAVTWFERRTGRGIAVAAVVLLTLATVGAFTYLLQRQLVGLSTQMTKYSSSMRAKLAVLRADGQGGMAAVSKTLDELANHLDDRMAESRQARPVRVIDDDASAADRIESIVEPVLAPLAQVLIVAVMVVFFLGKREDVRDRFLRLVGRSNVSVTTRTLDEAGQRISRFLVVQSLINAGFGLTVGLGLVLIGVPYAPLWGFVAAVLRFVPFIGSALGMLPPTLLAFAQLPGWWPTLETLALFLVLDLVTAYAVEPLAIGRKTGVSSIAMVVMAIFWTWLWGAPGLLLSTPLTVCLTVLGRHVPRLEFLAILLGDSAPLEAEVSFYQRLLAGDEDEAHALLERRRRQLPRPRVFDELVVPALMLAERDRGRGEISDDDHREVVRIMRGLVDGLPPEVPAGAATTDTPSATRRRVLGVPARSAADELVWHMLAQLFDPRAVAVEAVGPETLASEVSATAVDEAPDVVCIASAPPGGLTHVRYLIKRLRAGRPRLRVLVVRAGAAGDEADESCQALLQEGAVGVVFSLAEAQTRAEQLLLLAPPAPEPVTAETPLSLTPATSTTSAAR